MQTSIEEELKAYIISAIENGDLDHEEPDEFHNHLFNLGYYVSCNGSAKDWLEQHDIDAFEAIATVIEYENDNFGEVSASKYISAMPVVNMLVCIYGQELLSELAHESLAELREALDMDPACENHYDCINCREHWQIDGDSEHDDDCPECGTAMTPYYTNRDGTGSEYERGCAHEEMEKERGYDS